MSIIRPLLILALLAGWLFTSACQQKPAQQASQPSTAPQDTVAASPAERLPKIRTDIQDVKLALAKDGKYMCCVDPPCDWCLLHEGDCECRDNLEAGKEVCPGCGLGWHNGQGAVKGVDARKVKWAITHEHEKSQEHKH
ncbi:MAG: hypothetical protein HY710_10905 [Candidatus Latescibacteria bacterium]|nr:hypothetical protein [Candidatus Latescibacterota bacterium]